MEEVKLNWWASYDYFDMAGPLGSVFHALGYNLFTTICLANTYLCKLPISVVYFKNRKYASILIISIRAHQGVNSIRRADYQDLYTLSIRWAQGENKFRRQCFVPNPDRGCSRWWSGRWPAGRSGPWQSGRQRSTRWKTRGSRTERKAANYNFHIRH